MLLFRCSIKKSTDLKIQPSTVNCKQKKVYSIPTFAKKVQNFSNK